MSRASVCRDCAEALVHCHETLIVHVSGEVECTGTDCAGVVEEHVYVLECFELVPPCFCAG